MTEPNTSYTPGTTEAQPGRPATGRSNGDTGTGGIVDRVRQTATAQLTTQKDKASDGIGTVVNAVRHSGQQLRSEHHDTLAGYIEKAADQIDSLSRRMRDKDVGELLEEAQRFARRQPAVFIGSAFLLGLVAARFLKSSNPPDERSWEYRNRSYGGYGGSAAGAGSSGYESAISGPPYADVESEDLTPTSGSPSTPTSGRTAASGRRRTSGTERS